MDALNLHIVYAVHNSARLALGWKFLNYLSIWVLREFGIKIII